MMAYDNQFVLCVLKNGRPVREIAGKVTLPFHSEYKIRLKNKHSHLRAAAKLWIDGREVSNFGDFILNPNETVDIERFIDDSMSRGRKFKFVPLSDGRVNDPSDRENGIVKVEFYREKPRRPIRKQPIRPLRRDGSKSPIWQYGPSDNFSTPMTRSSYASSYTCDSNTSFDPEQLTSGGIISASNMPIPMAAGATVEGGSSNQGFSYGDHFETETYPVTITLRLKGIQNGDVDWEDRYSPRGRPFPKRPRQPEKRRIKFCPVCGGRRLGMAKFCQNCAAAYHPRYEKERR